MPEVRFSFEPSDIVNEVMSFGSPTPVEIAVSGPSFADRPRYSPKRLRSELATHSVLCAIFKSGSRWTIPRSK